jgi:hypothetical protein
MARRRRPPLTDDHTIEMAGEIVDATPPGPADLVEAVQATESGGRQNWK